MPASSANTTSDPTIAAVAIGKCTKKFEAQNNFWDDGDNADPIPISLSYTDRYVLVRYFVFRL
jgi:hypothetical protein